MLSPWRRYYYCYKAFLFHLRVEDVEPILQRRVALLILLGEQEEDEVGVVHPLLVRVPPQSPQPIDHPSKRRGADGVRRTQGVVRASWRRVWRGLRCVAAPWCAYDAVSAAVR